MNEAPQEFVTAADIARRLGVTPQRIRQLARDGRLPPPVGRVGRNTLWRWDSVADWATSTGRLDDESRPSTQAWRHRRSAPFTRVIDCVVPWGHKSTVHARVWQPREDDMRPVVLLGQLTDNPGKSVTNGIEAAATTVAAQLLGPGGLHADWYQYWPDSLGDEHEFHSVTFTVVPPSRATGLVRGAGRQIPRQRARLLGGELRHPKWTDIERETLERLIGEEVEVYPGSLYTADVVTRYAVEGPFEIEWDPAELKRDVEAALALLTASQTGIDADAVQTIARLLTSRHDERVTHNTRTAREQPRGLAVRLRPYEPSKADMSLVTKAIGSSAAKPLQTQTLAAVQQDLRRWLAANGSESDRLLLVPGVHGLTWLEPWEVGLDEQELVLGSELVGAIRHADHQTSAHLYDHSAVALDKDIPKAVPSEVLGAKGRWAKRYLETVSWWGPSVEDELRFRRLRPHLAEEAAVSTGYDPWGRLVLRTSEFFVTEWPLGPPALPPPEEATIVGDSSSRANNPVFIELPDGRLDLLPAPTNRSGGTSFTWGYSGGGPSTFAAALAQLISPINGDAVAAGRIYDFVVRLKTAKLHIPLEDLRKLASTHAATGA